MSKTKIEWTDRTWNPVTGCSQISPGCANCYAKTMAYRLKAMGIQKYINGFAPTIHINSLTEPLKWKKTSYCFRLFYV
jgi:protein gp37